MSLQILLPSYETQTPDHPQIEHQPSANKSATALELETLSRTVIDAMNTRSFDKIAQLVGSKYRANIDGVPKSNSYTDNLTDYQRLMRKDPEYRIEVVNVEADVDERADYAIVYCLLSVTGTPATVRRQSVSVVEWYRRGGQWQFFSATAMRGMDGTHIPWLGLT